MISRHPFKWLPASEQKWAFLVLLALTLAVMVSLNALDRPLKTEAAPADIISFEFAGDLATAQDILESWGPRGRVRAGVSLGLDYLYLVAYASCIALGCVLVARGVAGPVPFLAGVGVLLSWALFAAALLDAVENFALFQLLFGSRSEAWPAVARWCALPKFVIAEQRDPHPVQLQLLGQCPSAGGRGRGQRRAVHGPGRAEPRQSARQPGAYLERRMGVATALPGRHLPSRATG